jgi:hypothetical protein
MPLGTMEKIREEMAELFLDSLRVSVARVAQSYQKPYDHQFDTVPYPQGERISKFSGESDRSTHEHVGQFLAHLGELDFGRSSEFLFFFFFFMLIYVHVVVFTMHSSRGRLRTQGQG